MPPPFCELLIYVISELVVRTGRKAKAKTKINILQLNICGYAHIFFYIKGVSLWNEGYRKI